MRDLNFYNDDASSLFWGDNNMEENQQFEPKTPEISECLKVTYMHTHVNT